MSQRDGVQMVGVLAMAQLALAAVPVDSSAATRVVPRTEKIEELQRRSRRRVMKMEPVICSL